MEKEIILTNEEIQNICRDIASKLDDRFQKQNDTTPIFIGVLKGSMNFFMDLTQKVKSMILIDYIQVSSYEGTSSSGAVVLKKDLSLDIENKTIVIVEDVIDTGLTMHYLINFLKEKYHPKDVIIVSLFDKLYLRKVNLHVDYVGKVLTENKFLVGYGLDYNELLRNLPYVTIATKEDVEEMDKLLAQK